MKKSLIIQGGWAGHEPKECAELFRDELAKNDYEVTVSDSLTVLEDLEALKTYDLITPIWTMGELSDTQCENLLEAVKCGSGLGGFHGGMGDAFRKQLNYQWMVGGQFLMHPAICEYTVRVTDREHSISAELPERFDYVSEIYYMMIDPSIGILAETDHTFEGRTFTVPVIWTKTWGAGKVFYSALGHKAQEFIDYPHVREMTVRGMLWATR